MATSQVTARVRDEGLADADRAEDTHVMMGLEETQANERGDHVHDLVGQLAAALMLRTGTPLRGFARDDPMNLPQ